MPPERYTVRVAKDYLVFSAAHFITYNGGECERLHGHNWRVAVEVDGSLDENHYVFDFIALKDRAREITDRLDHRMLLPAESPLILVSGDEARISVHYKKRSWLFPRDECVVLPIPNTTAELIAKWIGGELLAALREQHKFVPDAMRVEVEESFGQMATWHWVRE
jgi:6-pyruvoyltetrahydropterin/6-carboxytetrahydropterin synthase